MFDAIVVGARCAGSPTAMLLARQGLRVLLVDRATFPSDTISTHLLLPPGVACLERWGLLDRVRASNCPPIRTMEFDLGPFSLAGEPGEMIAPRRTVLDKILLDAAAQAGVEVREDFPVSALIEGGILGPRGIKETARLIVGADGRNSTVAQAVGAPKYEVVEPLTCCYAYYVPYATDRVSIYQRPRRVVTTLPTNDGLSLVAFNLPRDQFAAIKSDLGRHLDATDIAPELSPKFRVGRIFGTADIPNFFRKPYGEGWALVGDAGHHKDPLLAHGMSDAFESAELLSDAVSTGDFAGYQRLRDERCRPAYDLACRAARFHPPRPEMLALYEALRHNEAERNHFFGALCGTVPIQEFFAPQNLAKIVGHSATR